MGTHTRPDEKAEEESATRVAARMMRMGRAVRDTDTNTEQRYPPHGHQDGYWVAGFLHLLFSLHEGKVNGYVGMSVEYRGPKRLLLLLLLFQQ